MSDDSRVPEILKSSTREIFDEYNDRGQGNYLDVILVRIGEFGRYQIFNYILLCMPMIFNAFQSISYVFTASPVVYRYVNKL